MRVFWSKNTTFDNTLLFILHSYADCQCVDYIKKRFPDLANYRGNAKDWGANLIRAGYKVVSTAQAGDIVVIQPFGSMHPAGHIGVVAAIEGGGIRIRGANQAAPFTSECGCNNVSNRMTVKAANMQRFVVAYRK
jgi:surface antigen